MTANTRNGRLLADRYQLIEVVGKGSMGQVYRAEDTLLGGGNVAVKFLSQSLLNPKMRDRFIQEAKISALLGKKSIHIVRVIDFGVDQNELPFYVMEFLEGESLSEIIPSRTITLRRFLRLSRQICLGMECAHQGILFEGEVCPIIHRDLKPSNIVILQDPTLGEMAKILDFGVAKLIQSRDAQTFSFMGTLAYCSPEQMDGKELDNRSDLYSLGVMMYEMLSDEMPLLPENQSFGSWYQAHHFTPPSPFSDDLNLPIELKQLIMSCLAKSPSDRPQSINEILSALEQIEFLIDPPLRPIDEEPLSADLRIPQELPGRKQEPQDLKQEDLADQLTHTPTSINVSAIPDICLQSEWPTNKPLRRIVFPKLMAAANEQFGSLWVMLDHQDLLARRSSARYNQFALLPSPHPMLLWITALYQSDCAPRWMPCYLDLKSANGLKMSRLLGETGYYRILFFALGQSKQCQHVIHVTIDPKQCQKLLDWANMAQGLPGNNPKLSKNILKREFEKLKPQIAKKLEAES